MNKTNWLLCIALCIVFLNACAPMPITQSVWAPVKPNINSPNSFRDDGHIQGAQNVLYSVGNDSGHIYLKLYIADRKTQGKIIRHGMTVWFDTTGHRKEKLGVVYPLSAKENSNEQDFKPQSMPQMQQGGIMDKAAQLEMRKKMLTSMIEMDLIGFSSSESLRVPALNNSGLTASIMLDSNGVLQYNLIVPFSVMHYHPAMHTGKKDLPLVIGIMSGKPESQGGKGGESGGGMQGGGGGMRGGRMGGGNGMGGGGGHGGGQGSPSEEPLDLWMEVKLAKF